MIESLLEADRLLALGLTDQAERIYWQAVELDPRNAIAVVGLARVASERGDDRTALQFARKALEIDPESPAASRLVARLTEIIETRGDALPRSSPAPVLGRETEATPEPTAPITPGPEATPEPTPAPTAEREVAPGPPAPVTPGPTAAPKPQPEKRRGLLDRLLGGR